MSIKNKVVLHNPTTKKHEPLASGDVLAGSIIQVSTDAGNLVHLGTDGGLKVEAVAQLPGKQVEFGAQEATTESYQTHVITFATAFPTVPFITLTSSIQEDVLNWQALNITTTGFTLEGCGPVSIAVTPPIEPTGYIGNVNWKAEEK